jgi:preprotein translocase subunit SecA
VDEFTGRVMVGRRYSEGLHQAIEAKERVVIRSESKTLATITFQNFFRMYNKLSGMTGTAKTEEEEFKGIYRLDVVTIPPNKPSLRKDDHDQIYTKVSGKMDAIVKDIEESHKKGQPVLVGTVSVEKSEELSKILKRKGIPHNVLNAKYHKQEAEIIAQAGKFSAVTIATNMAGRGTDIMLGGNPEFSAKQKMEKDGFAPEIIEMASSPYAYEEEGVKEAREVYHHHYDAFKKDAEEEKGKVIEAGGLRVIGTERHESRRIDLQLRGRSGRQGDPGSTVFYISTEDEVARLFGGERMNSMLTALRFPDDMPISNGVISKLIENAQKKVENRHYSIRKQVLAYDDVVNAQRELVYKERASVLDGMDIHSQILDMADELAEDIIEKHADYKEDFNNWDYAAFNTALEQRLLPAESNVVDVKLAEQYDIYKIKKAVMDVALKAYEDKIAKLKDDGIDFGDIERMVLLRTVDRLWMDHIDAMDALRRGIGLRGYGQQDPVLSYRREGWEMFEDMTRRIHLETAGTLFKVELSKREDGSAGLSKGKASVWGQAAHRDKVGRNDPCPCGSGLKYKNCCGKNK